jgi:hypothetical protein
VHELQRHAAAALLPLVDADATGSQTNLSAACVTRALDFAKALRRVQEFGTTFPNESFEDFGPASEDLLTLLTAEEVMQVHDALRPYLAGHRQDVLAAEACLQKVQEALGAKAAVELDLAFNILSAKYPSDWSTFCMLNASRDAERARDPRCSFVFLCICVRMLLR